MPRIQAKSFTSQKSYFTQKQRDLFIKEYKQFHQNITDFLIAKNALRRTSTGRIVVVSMPLETYCLHYAAYYQFDTLPFKHQLPKLLWESLLSEISDSLLQT